MEDRNFEFRMADGGDGNTLAGYAAVFNTPTRIRGESPREFDEIIAPGAFAKTINARERVVMQFDHGQHPFFGSLPIGTIQTMREDKQGLYVEARLSDNWFIQPVRDAISDGAVTGMSFRFQVPDGGDEWDRSGDTPLRTVREVKLHELGPVTFPAYEATTVGVRSALGLLSSEQRVDLLRQMSDPEDSQAFLGIVDNMKQEAAQLAQILAAAIEAGDDEIDDLYSVVSVLSQLGWLENSETQEQPETDGMGGGMMNSVDLTDLVSRQRLTKASQHATSDEDQRSTGRLLAVAQLELLQLRKKVHQ